MTTTLQSTSVTEAQTIGPVEIVERIIHEIQNNLQVIRMEAELKGIEPSERGHQCAFSAAQNIESLLDQVRQYFLESR
jgi:hypothetical protein